MIYLFVTLLILHGIGRYVEIQMVDPPMSLGAMITHLTLATLHAAIVFGVIFGLFILGRKIFRSFRTSRT